MGNQLISNHVFLGLLAVLLLALDKQPVVASLKDEPHDHRSAAEHHAGSHAVEADLVVPGEIPHQSRQRGHRDGSDALEHPHQPIARADSIRPKYIG